MQERFLSEYLNILCNVIQCKTISTICKFFSRHLKMCCYQNLNWYLEPPPRLRQYLCYGDHWWWYKIMTNIYHGFNHIFIVVLIINICQFSLFTNLLQHEGKSLPCVDEGSSLFGSDISCLITFQPYVTSEPSKRYTVTCVYTVSDFLRVKGNSCI